MDIKKDWLKRTQLRVTYSQLHFYANATHHCLTQLSVCLQLGLTFS